jgi:hypothetical protein
VECDCKAYIGEGVKGAFFKIQFPLLDHLSLLGNFMPNAYLEFFLPQIIF